MSLYEFCLLLVTVLTASTGQLFLKAGALKLGRVTSGNFVNHVLGIVTTPELILGLACYGVSAVLYILLLTRVNLSIAGPAVAIGYVFSVLLGYFFFKESIPVSRLVGLGMIISGVTLLLWKK